MGLFNKLRKGMKKQVAQMPRRSFLTGLRIPKRRSPLEDMITSGRLPQPSIGDMRFRGEMPQKPGNFRRSFLTGLRIPKRRTPLEDMIAGGRLPQPIPRAERMPTAPSGIAGLMDGLKNISIFGQKMPQPIQELCRRLICKISHKFLQGNLFKTMFVKILIYQTYSQERQTFKCSRRVVKPCLLSVVQLVLKLAWIHYQDNYFLV